MVKNIKKNSDSVAETWVNQAENDNSYFSNEHQIDNDFFNKVLRSRWITSLLINKSYNNFLEAGCFVGRFGLALATQGKKVTLMDCSSQSLHDAEILKSLAEKKFGQLDVTFKVDDLEKTNFKTGEFDVTFNEGVIEHWLERDDRVRIIREMKRLTRPGGLVSIRVINNKNWLYKLITNLVSRETPPYHKYNLNELKSEMKQAGLEIIETDGEMMNDPAHWIKNKYLLFILNIISLLINHLPKFLRQIFCPSIFCNGMVKKS